VLGPDLLKAARLIGLQKDDGGVRPIAVGDLVYRVAMKAILKTSYRSDMLLPWQLGVNTPRGVKPAIFILEEAIQGENKGGYNSLTILDLSNAFNSIERASIAAAVAKHALYLY
jgi:hypothetical protein